MSKISRQLLWQTLWYHKYKLWLGGGRQYTCAWGISLDGFTSKTYAGEYKIQWMQLSKYWLYNLTFHAAKLKMELFRKQRGSWTPTPISLFRKDFCPALMDPEEQWYQFFQSIPVEQRKCPIVKDVGKRFKLFYLILFESFVTKLYFL